MTTRNAAARRVEEDLANVGVPPKYNQVPPQDNQVPPQVQTLVLPPPMTDGETWSTFLTLDQPIPTKEQAVSTQVHAMAAHANMEVEPCVQQNSSTMVSRLRDFTRMNPPMFFGSNVHEDPK